MKNSALKKLTFSQKASLLILLLLVIALPLAALAAFNPVKLFKHAAGEVIPAPTLAPTLTPAPNTNYIRTTPSCVGPDAVNPSQHVDLVFSVHIGYPTVNKGFWMTFTDEITGQSTIHSYWSNSDTGGTLHGMVIPIRNQAGLPIIGDGRGYSVKVYEAPYTTGIPTLSNLIMQSWFSVNCLPTTAPTITPRPTTHSYPTATPPPAYKPTIITNSLPEGNVLASYKATIKGSQIHVVQKTGLTMSIAGLPSGFYKNCTSNTVGTGTLKTTTATCTITGKPTSSQSGLRTITVSLRDTFGQTVVKSLQLKINGRTTQ